MMSEDFAKFTAEHARLIILRRLHGENDGRLNDALLQVAMETYGITRNRDYVRTQMRALADLGAVTLTEAGTALIASITRAGADHVERRSIIEGVARPSPEV